MLFPLPLWLIIVIAIIVLVGWKIIKFAIKLLFIIFLILLVLALIYLLPIIKNLLG